MDHDQEIHGAVSKYPCNLCTFQTMHLSDIKTHKKSHMIKVPRDRNFQCLICFAKFTQNKYLEGHKKKQHTEKPCNNCHVTLPNLKELKKHINSNHHCSVCSFEANNRNELIMHRLSHPLDRKFLCSKCPNKFRRKYHLNEHKRRVHDEKPSSD